jgi:hypothetical protein
MSCRALALLPLLLLAACGGGDDDKDPTGPSTDAKKAFVARVADSAAVKAPSFGVGQPGATFRANAAPSSTVCKRYTAQLAAVRAQPVLGDRDAAVKPSEQRLAALVADACS